MSERNGTALPLTHDSIRAIVREEIAKVGELVASVPGLDGVEPRFKHCEALDHLETDLVGDHVLCQALSILGNLRSVFNYPLCDGQVLGDRLGEVERFQSSSPCVGVGTPTVGDGEAAGDVSPNLDSGGHKIPGLKSLINTGLEMWADEKLLADLDKAISAAIRGAVQSWSETK